MQEIRASDLLQRLGLVSAVAASVAIVDLLTKSIAEELLSRNGSVVITPFLNLRLGYNTGISFGLLRATSGSAVIAMIAVQSLIVMGLVLLAVRNSARLERLALALILGGALGNIVDRFQDGAVTDFLDVHLSGWHWPTFNVADIAITCGAVLLILVSLRLSQQANGI